MHKGFYNNQNRFPGLGSVSEKIMKFFRSKTILSNLILINIIVFLVVNLSGLLGWLFKLPTYSNLSYLAYYLSIPANIDTLGVRPWTVITYMFTHESFFHIFFNLLVLYFAGSIFKQYLPSKKLLLVYILGGITGAVFYVGAFNIFPIFENQINQSVALGASASVLAILVAAATYVPKYSVHFFLLGKIKLKHIAIVLVILDLISIRNGNSGGHISHLGGALFGFIYMSILKRRFSMNIWNKISSLLQRKRAFRKYKGGRPLSDEEYNNERAKNKERINIILDKISKHGYNNLSKEEKEFLFRQSNKS
ncbi:MAG: rhomboid family intramembrane serine protease [Hyphomicrobiales bacterium]